MPSKILDREEKEKEVDIGRDVKRHRQTARHRDPATNPKLWPIRGQLHETMLRDWS